MGPHRQRQQFLTARRHHRVTLFVFTHQRPLFIVLPFVILHVVNDITARLLNAIGAIAGATGRMGAGIRSRDLKGLRGDNPIQFLLLACFTIDH